MPPRKKSIAASFAATEEAKRYTGGSVCRTCSFARRKEVEAECQVWNELRREGKTSAPWCVFQRVLESELGYSIKSRSLLAHLKNCLGWTIH